MLLFDFVDVVVVNEDEASGLIMVAGVEYKTDYKVQGFNRRWDFGGDGDNNSIFSFIQDIQ